MTTLATPPTLDAKTIHLHPQQARAFSDPARFVAAIAGTGGGKTYLGPLWLSERIAEHPEGPFLVVSPTYKILSRATMPMLVATFRGTDFEGVWKETKGQYVLPTGGIIYTGSADRPESLEGGQYWAAWLDEGGQMTYWLWVVIQARLGQHQGRCLITTTPYATNWLKKEWYDRWRAGDADYAVIQWPSDANPAYPRAELLRAKATLAPAIFEMRYLGQFRQMEGLVYPEFVNCIADNREVPEGWRRVGGIDWGFSAPTVVLTGAVDADDVLWIYHEWAKPGTVAAERTAQLKPQVAYYADPADKTAAEEVRRLGGLVREANNAVAEGIARVTARIRTGRLKVMRDACPVLIDEAEMYHYKEDDESDKPVKEADHAMDALRYLIAGLDRHRKASLIVVGPDVPQAATAADVTADTAKHPDALRITDVGQAPRPRDDDEREGAWLSVDNDAIWS